MNVTEFLTRLVCGFLVTDAILFAAAFVVWMFNKMKEQ